MSQLLDAKFVCFLHFFEKNEPHSRIFFLRTTQTIPRTLIKLEQIWHTFCVKSAQLFELHF